MPEYKLLQVFIYIINNLLSVQRTDHLEELGHVLYTFAKTPRGAYLMWHERVNWKQLVESKLIIPSFGAMAMNWIKAWITQCVASAPMEAQQDIQALLAFCDQVPMPTLQLIPKGRPINEQYQYRITNTTPEHVQWYPSQINMLVPELYPAEVQTTVHSKLKMEDVPPSTTATTHSPVTIPPPPPPTAIRQLSSSPSLKRPREDDTREHERDAKKPKHNMDSMHPARPQPVESKIPPPPPVLEKRSTPPLMSVPGYKTQECRYYSTPGGCNKGAKCTYAHGHYDMKAHGGYSYK